MADSQNDLSIESNCDLLIMVGSNLHNFWVNVYVRPKLIRVSTELLKIVYRYNKVVKVIKVVKIY